MFINGSFQTIYTVKDEQIDGNSKEATLAMGKVPSCILKTV